jgi:hypothetical protein
MQAASNHSLPDMPGIRDNACEPCCRSRVLVHPSKIHWTGAVGWGKLSRRRAPLSRVLPCGVDPLHGILRRGKSQTSNDQLTVSVGDLGLPSVYGQASSVEYRALSDMRALFGL